MSDIISQAFKEGAAEINRLRAHITELEADLKASREVSVGLQTMVAKLEAEVKRLKEDLKEADEVYVDDSERIASLRSTLAQVREWYGELNNGDVEGTDWIILDSPLSTDNEVLAVVEGGIDWDGEGSHQVACLYARLPGKHWEYGKKYPVTVTRRKED